MEPLAFLRRTLLGLAGTALAAVVLAVSAHSSELVGTGSAHGIVIHDAESTLRDFCERDAGGVLWLVLPGGERYELVTSTDDAAIANPGDGAFHPYDVAVVRDALQHVSFPLERVSVDIYLLPFPRRNGLDSAAGPGLILLAPGVREMSLEHQHAEFTHELGHVVQYAFMPDADAERWASYRRMRGIEDPTVYSAGAAHADRPHEIFAEDFRTLFGDGLANYSHSIENSSIESPSAVTGLTTFIADLAGEPAAPLRLAAFPNPSRGALRFSRSGASVQSLDLFDLAGRRVASVTATPISGGTVWAWDGTDASGRNVGPGVVFARVRGESGGATRVTLTR